MEMKKGSVVRWKIENFSHWCWEAHGEIKKNTGTRNMCMYLYPKGIGGQGEYLVLRIHGDIESCSGELSFYSSDGSLLCKQPVNAGLNERDLEHLPGLKFEDVVSRIRESEDFITVAIWLRNPEDIEHHIFTTINAFKVSLEINPKWIAEMESYETKEFFCIHPSSVCELDRVRLEICSSNDSVQFRIRPQIMFMNDRFTVEMGLTRSDGIIDSCVKEKHVFRTLRPWIFPYPLEKKELAEKRISLFFCLKTKFSVRSPLYLNCAYSCVSIESDNRICFPEKATVTSNNDSVLIKDLMMCLYQDQHLSDINLKCDNVSFPVHKVILSARSPVFKTMLSTDMKEAGSGQVDIEDLDPSTVSRFLTYLYIGEVEEELQCDGALKLYYAADKYQVPSLKKVCSKFLCSNLSVSNVCDILSLADRHEDNDLATVSRNFISSHYNEVMGSREWKSLMKNEPVLVGETTLVLYFGEMGFFGKHNPQ